MRLWPEVVYTWGSTAAERAEPFACDEVLPDAPEHLHRAVDVAAPRATVFRWLCQLRAAPYSYDLIDNFGRRSPPRLTPGLEHLEVGQPVMSIFRLVAFEPQRSLTILSRGSVFGPVACTYRVEDAGPQASRLVVKLRFAYPPGAARALGMRALLPAGDAVMMRRQLLNLKQLAEREARGRRASQPA